MSPTQLARRLSRGAVIASGLGRTTARRQPPRDGHRVLPVVLSARAANAVVYTTAIEAVAEAEQLDSAAVSSRSTDLLAISVRCARISRLAAINDQLGWSAQRSATSAPAVISAGAAVLRELAAELEATVVDHAECPDERLQNLAFDEAAREIRATLCADGP